MSKEHAVYIVLLAVWAIAIAAFASRYIVPMVVVLASVAILYVVCSLWGRK